MKAKSDKTWRMAQRRALLFELPKPFMDNTAALWLPILMQMLITWERR